MYAGRQQQPHGGQQPHAKRTTTHSRHRLQTAALGKAIQQHSIGGGDGGSDLQVDGAEVQERDANSAGGEGEGAGTGRDAAECRSEATDDGRRLRSTPHTTPKVGLGRSTQGDGHGRTEDKNHTPNGHQHTVD